MISSLKGILKSKNPTEVLIDVNDIGYSVNIPLSTYEKLGEVGTSVFFFTHFHVREDSVQLFGFFTEEERRIFKLLISVTGIGPKIAQSILSGVNAQELMSHIGNGNADALTSIPGIGRKTAERIIVELRDKIKRISPEPESAFPGGPEGAAVRLEALQALVSLGYNQQMAEKAIRAALKGAETTTISVEELIKRALRHTNAR
jgi:holliday junction DNA helicase RuvA